MTSKRIRSARKTQQTWWMLESSTPDQMLDMLYDVTRIAVSHDNINILPRTHDDCNPNVSRSLHSFPPHHDCNNCNAVRKTRGQQWR